MTKNKFSKPPYLPNFNEAVAIKLGVILQTMDKEMISTARGIRIIKQLISRPSTIRKCDLGELKPMVGIINNMDVHQPTIAEFIEQRYLMGPIKNREDHKYLVLDVIDGLYFFAHYGDTIHVPKKEGQ